MDQDTLKKAKDIDARLHEIDFAFERVEQADAHNLCYFGKLLGENSISQIRRIILMDLSKQSRCLEADFEDL